MPERRKIVELGRQCRPAVLITLVRVEGSSYRRVGAKMLVAEDRRYAGTISGGCLEAEVVQKAAWMVRNGAVIERFSTLFDDTAEIPYGLGCGGTVALLLEPAGTAEFIAAMAALEASIGGEMRQVETRLPDDGLPMLRRVKNGAGEVVFASAGWTDPPEGEVFAEEWLPPQRLIVAGAGNDAQPVVRLAALLGWNVTVADGRSQLARAGRFPEAVHVVVTETPEQVEVCPRDAVVVMTHSYEQDRAWLTAVLPRGPRYLGLLGARHRSALLVSDAATALGWSVEQVCARVSAPVGLDLGGDGAEAIALAIVAEIHASCEGKLGASQRMTPAMVAGLVAQRGAEVYRQTQCAL